MSKRPGSFAVLAVLAWVAAAPAAPDYPPAPREEAVDIYHGQTVPDPYRWLEDEASDRTRTWVDAQGELLEQSLDAARRDELMRRLGELTGFVVYGKPVRAGSRYFFTRMEPAQPGGTILVQERLDGHSRVVLDPAKLGVEGSRIAGLSPSRDGRLLAYLVVQGTSNWRVLRVRDVDSGRDLGDRLEGLHSTSTAVNWLADGSGFYYVRQSRPEEGSEQPGASRVLFHRLGTDQNQDAVVYARPDQPNWLLTHRLTRDGRHLFVTSSAGGSTHTRVFYREEGEAANFVPLFNRGDATYTFLASIDGRFVFYTTESAPRGRIVALDAADPDELIEIVPQAEEAIAGGSLVGGNAVGVHGGRLLITYVRDARPRVRIFDLEGTLEHDVALPDIGAIWGGFSGGPDDPEVFYNFLSLTDPNTVFRLDVNTGVSTVYKRPELPFDPADFVTRQVFYHSKDGTRVPMFVTHRRDFEADGKARGFVYGYGAWGWIAFPWYQPHVLTLLQHGWVYALPGIRGGGEYGESWHQAGIRRNKQTAIDDYLYAARWLIENRYTSADRLVANGGSASGALAAAAVLQRPDLFGSAVIDIPVLDMLRYDRLTPTRHAWTSEIGSIDDPGDFAALLGYSPYHNVKPGTCYPPLLTLVGEGDELAPPPHSYKFTAALQQAQACDHPVMLKLIPGAGHSHGSTREQTARTWAAAITFIEQVLPGDP